MTARDRGGKGGPSLFDPGPRPPPPPRRFPLTCGPGVVAGGPGQIPGEGVGQVEDGPGQHDDVIEVQQRHDHLGGIAHSCNIGKQRTLNK